jgi:uncharacterized protein YdeI (YjbR/CyaY-like superfamily)
VPSVSPCSIRAFPSAAAFESWLAANFATAPELWIKIHKKDSGLATVTNAEAIDIALCWGWIDGLRKGLDAHSYLQRFTPRQPRSIWSQVNTRHVARLIAEGRMQPSGHTQVEAAKADGRWERAYAGGRDMVVPDDLMAAITAKPAALATFDTLNRLNQFAMAFRLGNIKTPGVRAKRVAEYVAMLARGETLLPNGKHAAKRETKPMTVPKSKTKPKADD